MIRLMKGYHLLNSDGAVQGFKGVLKKLQDKEDNYYYYILDRRKTYVHRLIGMYYIPKPKGWTMKWTVNHIDGDKTNNSLNNLEWVTKGQNLIHAHETDLRPRTANKLSDEKALEIYNYYHDNNMNYTQMQEKFGIHRQVVQQLVNKISYKHIHRRYYESN